MAKKYSVALSEAQRERLRQVISSGRSPAREPAHARVLPRADEGATDPVVAAEVRVSSRTVERVRKRFAERGLDAALARQPQPPRPDKRVLDGAAEARLVTLACSRPPDGHWTLDAGPAGGPDGAAERRAGRVPGHGPAGDEKDVTKGAGTGGRPATPWLVDEWCIPEAGCEFVWRMEDVLDVYHRPYDARYPVVGPDEKPVRLLSDKRGTLPCRPGDAARRDYEYGREGTANVLRAFERSGNRRPPRDPLANWRELKVAGRRTRPDFAAFVRGLVGGRYKEAERVVLVIGNLTTHTPASLYEAFGPEEARRITRKLEVHYTPRHGSWLNVAEVELSVLGRRLPARVPDAASLAAHAAAVARDRNDAGDTCDWQFTTADARVKLKRLYPTIEVR